MEKIRLDWMMTDQAGFNVGTTDRCGPAGAADLLIGDNDTRLGSPHLQRLVWWDRLNEGLDVSIKEHTRA